MSERLRQAALQALFGALNLALAAPSVYLWLGLPMIMRQHGWSGAELGLFQLAGLPAVFKFLLASPVERYRWGKGHYRSWAISLCLLFALVLGLIGQQELLSSSKVLFVLALAAACLATWADIPVNALAIKLLPASQRMRAGGIRSAAISLGAIVGGGVMLLVQFRWGWQAPFWIMAGLLLLGAVGLAAVREPGPDIHQPPSLAHASAWWIEWQSYLAQPGAKAWTGLLLLYFPFNGAAWFYLKPLLLDQGLAPNQVALIAGIGGGIAAALASLMTVRLIRTIGLMNALPVGALLSLLALTGLATALVLKAGPVALAAGTLALAVTMGGSASLAFGMMMHFTRAARDAADYGLQASLFALTRLMLPLLAGAVLDRYGYSVMLLALAGAMALVLVFTLHKRRSIVDAMGIGLQSRPTC